MSRRRAVAVLAGALLTLGATSALAEPQVPGLPDPTDCHEVQRFLHLTNVVSCDGPPTERTSTAPPPLPVGVQQRSDGAICVTVSYQVPQCVGPFA